MLTFENLQSDVTCLPGVNSITAEQMHASGITHVSQVFGKFLTLKKNKELFLDWMKMFGACDEQCFICFDALYAFSQHHM